MSTIQRKLGHRIRQLRKQKEWTQEQLAEACDISLKFISNLERGVDSPSLDTMERLADALDGNSSGGVDGSVMPSVIETFYTFGPKWAVLGRHS